MIGIIVQARTRSSRFPRKIFEDINGKYTLQRVLDGVVSSRLAHKIILAVPEYDRQEITNRIESGELNNYIKHRGFSVFCGEPEDVLKRYYDAAGINGIDLVVRVTADCPFVQGDIIDDMLSVYLSNGYNGFMGNNENIATRPFPDGTDVEIFPWWLLAEAHKSAEKSSDREHVTPIMFRDGSALRGNVYSFENNRRITMKHPIFSFDTQEDYELIKKIAEKYDECGDLNMALENVDD
jgi:spore coat polysaccharide biosynthesis protein SpsF (cytidylyltransferase family)